MNMKRLKQIKLRMNKSLFIACLPQQFLFFLLLSALSISSLHAQETRGTGFVVSFPRIDNATVVSVESRIRVTSGGAPTTGTLTFTGLTGADRVVHFSVPADSVYSHTLTALQRDAAYTFTEGVNNNKAVLISTDAPASAYAYNYALLSTERVEATNLLPIPTLGTEYRHMGGVSSDMSSDQRHDQYMIVAIQDGTDIYENGVAIATNLAAGATLLRRCEETYIDMTGRLITSNHPIAYFAAHLDYHRQGVGSNFFQQLMPVNTWGKRFVVPVTDTFLDIVRIVASEDNTTVIQEGAFMVDANNANPASAPTTRVLSAGQRIELRVHRYAHIYGWSTGCYIRSDKPIQVAAYIPGRDYPHALNAYRSEAFTIVPPLEQYIKRTTVAPFIGGRVWNHSLIIVTPTATRENTRVTLSGRKTALFNGNWHIMRNGMSFFEMKLHTHSELEYPYTFENDAGLLVYSYGMGGSLYTSYYTVGGAAARDLTASLFVNDINVRELDGEYFCLPATLNFRAEFVGNLSPLPGHLEWYINGVEDVSLKDQLTWSTSSWPVGNYEVKIVARMDDELTIRTVTSDSIRVIDPQKLQISGTPTICAPATSTILTATSGPTSYQWYRNGTLIADSTQRTYTVTSADVGNYTVVGHYGTACSTPMSDPITVVLGCGAEVVPDTVSGLQNTPILIDVLANDNISSCPTVIPTPAAIFGTQGSAVTSGNRIQYTPATDFLGRDSLEYSIVCSGTTYTAKIYINIVGITANNVTICSGEAASLTASLINPALVTGPVFNWYSTATGGIPLHTGPTYNPSPSATTTYYVSVKGSNYSQSPRKAVTVTVTPTATPDMIKITQ